jgi:magnesium transporter
MLVRCTVYQKGRKLCDIPPDEIHEYLDEPGCFVWVALADAEPQMLDKMQEQFGLHPLAVEDARQGHQRPKLEEYGDSLFVVMHMIELDGEDVRQGELHVFVGPNYVLSVRIGARQTLQEVRARSEREPELLRNGAGYVLYALMDAVVDRYFPVLHALEAQLETVEERLFERATGSPQEVLKALYGIKRKLALLKHAVSPLPEIIGRLFGGRVPHLTSGMQEHFRDVYDHALRLNQSIDSLSDTVITATSVNLSMISLAENETMKRLAAYGALVAVPTMIAGIYGMNFQHMPELATRWGYPLTLAVMAVIDGYLFYRLRKAKWL